MPTVFSHAAVGAAASRFIATPAISPRRIAAWSALCAIVPDFDVVGIPGIDLWDNAFAHRGFTHSIAFAMLIGTVVATMLTLMMRANADDARAVGLRLGVYFSSITLSHPLLDMLTSGGPGVQLFAPFSAARLFFPWRPIEVSPLGAGFFSARGLTVIASELLWIGLPLVSLLLLRRRRR